jgi:hypothetical protein
MQNPQKCSPNPVFVVVVQEILVARDIEMIIRGVVPGALVLLAPGLEMAAESLPPGRIDAAFVQTDPQDLARSALGQRVAADGGRLVLVGIEPDIRAPEGWARLPFPFSESDVSALLAKTGCNAA